MKKFLLSTTFITLALTLVLSLASCEEKPDNSSLISTTAEETTTVPETTQHEHSYAAVVTPPTCTEPGYTTYTCSCGDTYTADPTEALGHDFGEWVTTKAATCTQAGIETRTCSRCSATETREIPMSAHQYVDVVTPPTKTTQGYTTHTCVICKDSYIDSYTNATGSVGLEYSTNPDGSLTITGMGTCTDEDIIIYSTNKDGKSVTGISENAFRNNTTIKTVYLPASVTSIGNGAFAGCTKLTTITVESENSNYSAAGGVLFSKDGATLVVYPAGLTLTSYTVSTSITAISPSAFAGCSTIAEFKIATGHTIFSVLDGVLYDYDQKSLIAFPAGKTAASFSVPGTVETIGDYAFYNAKLLSAVTMPDRVLETDGTTISIPGISTIGSFAFCGCSGITTITIPDITSSVATYAFAECTGLTTINFGKGIDTISAHCFEGCTAIVNLTIPTTIETIEEYAFYNCTGMTTLVIRSGVRKIGAKAFTGCLNQGKDTNGKNIAKVYFEGTSDFWNGSTMSIDPTNTMYLTIYADIYFYSATSVTGNYWHFVGDVATAW